MAADLIPVTVLGLLGNRRYRAGLGPFKRGQEYRLDVTQKQYEALRADPYLGVRIVKDAPPTFAPAAQGASVTHCPPEGGDRPPLGGHAAGGAAPPAPAPASAPECNEPCKGDCCEDCPCPADPVDPVETAPKRAVKTAKKAKSP